MRAPVVVDGFFYVRMVDDVFLQLRSPREQGLGGGEGTC
jgi:hypothetical protein